MTTLLVADGVTDPTDPAQLREVVLAVSEALPGWTIDLSGRTGTAAAIARITLARLRALAGGSACLCGHARERHLDDTGDWTACHPLYLCGCLAYTPPRPLDGE